MSKEINFVEFFLKTCKKKKNKIAIIENKKKISFQKLKYKSLLFSKIITNSISKNKIIPIIQEKNILNIVSNLAILVSGNAYMNIDSNLPFAQIKSILDNIKPDLVITDNLNFNKVFKFQNKIKIISIDKFIFKGKVNEKKILQNLSNKIDTDPFCVINTSGSTGQPKSTILNHRNFIDFTIRSDEIFKFSGKEKIGSLSSNAFDIFSFEMCLMMYKGSCLVLIPEKLKPFPIDILKLLKKERVSFIFWVPTIMVMIANLNLLNKIKLNELRLIWFAGEVFPTEKFNYWRKKLSKKTVFANLYGPIEITLDCSYYIIKRNFKNNEIIPIGFKYRNTDLLILKNNKPIKKNEIGEICVRGSSLAMGYYNNPTETKKRFTQNPLNKHYPEIIYRTGDFAKYNNKNEIIFLGRQDNQIKHFGHRIELDEIEHILINKLKIVNNGCAIYDFKKKKIIFYYERNEIISEKIINKISKHFSKYSMPQKWHHMHKLPVNLNGKIDRLKLKKLN